MVTDSEAPRPAAVDRRAEAWHQPRLPVLSGHRQNFFRDFDGDGVALLLLRNADGGHFATALSIKILRDLRDGLAQEEISERRKAEKKRQ